MASGLKWNGKQFEKELNKATAAGLLSAGTHFHTKCLEKVSKSAGPTSVNYRDQSKGAKSERKNKGDNQTSYTVYKTPSKPGEAPRLRTGFGQRNIVINHNAKEMYVRVGVAQNVIYMFYLEVGTRFIARRPWLLKTLEENHHIIGKLAASGK